MLILPLAESHPEIVLLCFIRNSIALISVVRKKNTFERFLKNLNCWDTLNHVEQGHSNPAWLSPVGLLVLERLVADTHNTATAQQSSRVESSE